MRVTSEQKTSPSVHAPGQGRRALPKLAVYALVLAAMAPVSASAKDLFDVTVTAGGTQGTQGFSTFEDFTDVLYDSTNLATVNPAYNDMTPAFVSGNFRGLDVSVTYPDAGPSLVFAVDQLGISIPFDGALTREGNEDALGDFLEADTDGVLTAILRGLVALTPFDPVAGNPNSLQGKMVAADFGVGTGINSPSYSAASGSGDGDDPNLIGFGARLGRYTADGFNITTLDLPLSYTIPLADPRYGIVLDLPLSYTDTEGADSFAASFGVGLRVPIFDNWSVTPTVRAGGTGSIDLGSVSPMYSAGITSSVTWSAFGLDFELGNMFTYLETGDVGRDIGGFRIDYNLSNTVMRHGIEVGGDLKGRVFGQPTTWELSAVNTQIFGDDVFIDNYTDIAFSIGTKASKNRLTWDSLRLGLTYTFTNEDYQGFRLNFGYQF